MVALVLGLGALALVSRRWRRPTHVLVQGRWVVGARLAQADPERPRLIDTLRRRWHVRQAHAYVAGEWRRDVAFTAIRLERKAVQHVRVRVEPAYEIELAPPMRRLSQVRLQLQVATVTFSALMTALVLGRDRETTLPPHESYVPGEPAAVSVTPARWLMNSLSTPSPHPFRTSTPAEASPQVLPRVDIPMGGHSNTNAWHSNVPLSHTNTFTAHTNTDTRPVPGPF